MGTGASDRVDHPSKRGSHLTLKIFHNIQENVIHIRPVMELDLHGIQVAKSVSHVELTVRRAVLILWSGLGGIWVGLLLYCKQWLWYGCCRRRR